ncbi:hypothetical protein [Caulobacter sp. 1776]|uniref:hypothetical protein n=1 Tax=Caulobacter sp. 1776 TaxID=3156420 RepID=UPI0033938693
MGESKTPEDTLAYRMGEIGAIKELLATLLKHHPMGHQVLDEVQQRIDTALAGGAFAPVGRRFEDGLQDTLSFTRKRIEGDQ